MPKSASFVGMYSNRCCVCHGRPRFIYDDMTGVVQLGCSYAEIPTAVATIDVMGGGSLCWSVGLINCFGVIVSGYE